jgi:hypothetical protein
VAVVVVLVDGALSLAAGGVLDAWLSFAACGVVIEAGAVTMTVRVLVEVRPLWSVTT